LNHFTDLRIVHTLLVQAPEGWYDTTHDGFSFG
jgi:hypothetical protein